MYALKDCPSDGEVLVDEFIEVICTVIRYVENEEELELETKDPFTITGETKPDVIYGETLVITAFLKRLCDSAENTTASCSKGSEENPEGICEKSLSRIVEL